MPPVQNIATLGLRPVWACSACAWFTQSGSCEKLWILGLMAPAKVPISTS
jgi:hypothetical protein